MFVKLLKIMEPLGEVQQLVFVFNKLSQKLVAVLGNQKRVH